MALSFVGLYVALAKHTFESDKISYIYESQQRQVSSLARSLDQQAERILFDTRAILLGYDPQTKSLGPGAQKVFWEHPKILALQLQSQDGRALSLQLEKTKGLLEEFSDQWPDERQVDLTPLGNDLFILATSQKVPDFGLVKTQVIFDYKESLGSHVKGQLITLSYEGRVIKRSPGSQISDSEVRQALESLPKVETTLVRELNEGRQLVSIARTDFGGLLIASFTAESAALGALSVLFQRSIIFLGLSFFATIILSLLLANGLTQSINSLTKTAELIGRGDFSAKASVSSRDEIGVLAKAFAKMTAEIQRLLSETVEKTRMEEELKTARLVQESLYPTQSFYSNAHIRLFGMNKTTTECSGDWWFYYQKDSSLYALVADATGHGIPAALITAAARSIFSLVKERDATLTEIIRHWDRAIYECSNAKVFMTAFVMKINVELGDVEFINAGHEPPILLKPSEDGRFKATYLGSQQNHALGECKNLWLEDRIQLEPGERLFIYTDGLLAVKSPQGKSYSERRFLTYLEKNLKIEMGPEAIVETVDKHFMELNEGQSLPDDITIMALDFKAVLNPKTEDA